MFELPVSWAVGGSRSTLREPIQTPHRNGTGVVSNRERQCETTTGPSPASWNHLEVLIKVYLAETRRAGGELSNLHMFVIVGIVLFL